jgi:hypothetical protein
MSDGGTALFEIASGYSLWEYFGSFYFETRSHVAQTGLQCAILLPLPLSAGITGISHSTLQESIF